MKRGESWIGWGLGLLFGAAAGFMILVGGAPLLFLAIALLAFAYVAVRSLAFLSGALLGAGVTWLMLGIRAQLACDADPTCLGSEGAAQFLALCAVLVVGGLVLGVLARRHATSPRYRARP